MAIKKEWKKAKNILCIRPDGIGDLIMTTPAIRALKKSLPGSRVTILVSSHNSEIARYIPEIDKIIVADLPWVKNPNGNIDAKGLQKVISRLKREKFDAGVIFTVFSQNSAAAALLLYLAQVPLRLAYGHNKIYDLLTDWVPDPEPDLMIRHEAKRQLDLVKSVGAIATDKSYSLDVPEITKNRLKEKFGMFDLEQPFIVVHPGASEIKRRYSISAFCEVITALHNRIGLPIILTGNKSEGKICSKIVGQVDAPVFNSAGLLELNELIELIRMSSLLISNNTGPVHIASAVKTPVVDLYALTNPQHTPWMTRHEVLYFDVDEKFRKTVICNQKPKGSRMIIDSNCITKAAMRLLER